MSRLFSFLTPPVIIAASLVVALGAIGLVFLSTSATPQIAWSAVTSGSVVQLITATGSVAPVESVDLGFQRTGRVANISVAVGSHVVAGQALAILQNADLQAAREQAAANLSAAQAKLALVQAGTRPQALATARQSVADDIQAGFVAADDAVHNKIDQFLNSPNSSSPSITFQTSDQSLQQNLVNERVAIAQTLSDLQSRQVSGDVSSDTKLSAGAQASMQDLQKVEQLLDTANAMLATAIPNAPLPAATIAAYQTSVSTARTNVSGALSTLTAAEGALTLDEAGATSQDIDAAQAAVAGAQAALDAANATLAQTVLVAPIAGIITRQDGHAGQVVSPGVPFISLNSDARFELKAYVSEADIGKIHVGDTATAALDAYPGVAFKTLVVSVDPAATMQNGVPSYLVTVQFTDIDARIKAGLTGTLSITSGKADNALLVPSTALITKGSQTYVLRRSGNASELIPVSVGIENSGGQAQILSGLSSGDQIASFGASATQ